MHESLGAAGHNTPRSNPLLTSQAFRLTGRPKKDPHRFLDAVTAPPATK